jgi:glutaminyl-tRNA synthetase
VRLYQHLFTSERPDDGELENIINPNSLEVLENAFVEPILGEANVGETVQFERTGYFCLDPDTKPGQPVFNRTVTLKDSWVKIEGKGK